MLQRRLSFVAAQQVQAGTPRFPESEDAVWTREEEETGHAGGQVGRGAVGAGGGRGVCSKEPKELVPGVSTGAGEMGRASSSWRGVPTPPQQRGPLGGPVQGGDSVWLLGFGRYLRLPVENRL